MRFLPPASVLPTLLVSPLWAAEFQVSPTFSLSQYYTDNVALAPAGLERSDWVTIAQPGVNASYNGAKLHFTATYNAQVLYRESTGGVEVKNQFSGGTNGSMELVPQFLFVDTSSTVSQYNTSINQPLATNNVNTTNNRTTVQATSLSPFVRYNFGGETVGEVRYTFSSVTSGAANTAFSNSTSNRLSTRLASGPAYKLTGWNLAYSKETIDYDSGQRTDLENFAATARRLITPVFAVRASAGYETNDYSTANVDQPNGSGVYWNVGFDWTPTPRTNLSATTGHRYFGKTYGLDFSHRMRLFFVNAGYAEEITTTRSQFLVPTQANTATYLDTLLLSRIPDPVARQQAVQQEIARSGLPPTLIVPVNFFTDQAFLQKSWRAGAGFQGALHSVVANFYTSTRETQTPGLSAGAGDFATSPEIDQIGGSVSWSYRITSFTSSAVSLNYSRSHTAGATSDDTLKYARVSLNTQLGRKTSGVVSYQRSDSNVAPSGYTENQVAAQLYMSF